MDRNGDPVTGALLDAFLEEFAIQLEPITVEQAHVARQAFQLFGKGIHPAALNFGDCFAYALAKVSREPILFKGQDFSRTDLLPAIRLEPQSRTRHPHPGHTNSWVPHSRKIARQTRDLV